MIDIEDLKDLTRQRQEKIAINTDKAKNQVKYIVEDKLKQAAYRLQRNTTINVAHETSPEVFKVYFRMSLEDVNIDDIIEEFNVVVKSLKPLGYKVSSNEELFTKSKHFVIEW